MKISDFDIKKEGKYYYRGNWDKNIFKKSIAIVGSRQMTRYGGEVIDKFVADFVANKVTTISGFMYGVDTQVAKKTIEYGGKHIAVLGSGLDVIYPVENEKLYLQILESGGLLISEYEPSAQAHPWKFPQRNKVVVKLSSLGVLVIEAGEGSGSLITAKIAIKLGKSVYAVPGPVTSKVSVGTNNLIKRGEAKLVTSVGDILGKRLAISNKPLENTNLELDGIELKIYKTLELEPLDIDEISRKLNKNIIEIGSTLSLMGIKNLVTESGGKYYLNK